MPLQLRLLPLLKIELCLLITSNNDVMIRAPIQALDELLDLHVELHVFAGIPFVLLDADHWDKCEITVRSRSRVTGESLADLDFLDERTPALAIRNTTLELKSHERMLVEKVEPGIDDRDREIVDTEILLIRPRTNVGDNRDIRPRLVNASAETTAPREDGRSASDGEQC